MVLCQECRRALVEGGEGTTVTVQVGPILREAVASVGAGEDIDEALLRALKARYPEEAANLLAAISRIVEMAAREANESTEQAIRRLAESQPGPEITLRRAGGRVVEGGFPTTVSETVSETHVIRVGDKEYRSLEEVPPHIRRAIEGAKAKGRRGRRIVVAGSDTRRRRPGADGAGLKSGCSWVLAAPLLGALLRLLGK